MPDRYAVAPRTVLGKHVKKLRREGMLPGNIYGRGVESKAVQLPASQARIMLTQHGRNVLIELDVEGESAPRPVVIRKLDRHPVSGDYEHIDFFQVDLSRPIHGDVYVVLTGEAPVVNVHGGVLMQQAEYVSVEALPSDMPERLEVSVEGLEEFDQSLTVADLSPPPGVRILTDPDTTVVAVARPRLVSEEVAEEAAAEEAAEAEETPQEAQAEAAAEAASEASEGQSEEE